MRPIREQLRELAGVPPRRMTIEYSSWFAPDPRRMEVGPWKYPSFTLEFRALDPAPFRDVLGRFNSREIVGVPAGCLFITGVKVSPDVVKGDFAVRLNLERYGIPIPGENEAVDFDELLPGDGEPPAGPPESPIEPHPGSWRDRPPLL